MRLSGGSNAARQPSATALLAVALAEFGEVVDFDHGAVWTIEQRWRLLFTHIFRRWLGGKWLGELPPQAALFLSG